jgi:hypothetical protein
VTDEAEAQADALLHEAAELEAELARLSAAHVDQTHLRDRLAELQRRIAFLTGAPCVWGEPVIPITVPAPKAA